METKFFGDKKITIRTLKKSDVKNAKKWLKYINDLIAEDAKLLVNGKMMLKDEITFLEKTLKGIKDKTEVYLFAECGDKIIAGTGIKLNPMRKNHIGTFGIAISDGYRGMGLGKYLTTEILKMAEENLKPSLKMIDLGVYTNNKAGIALYKKMGFKQVAKLPKQMQWKDKLVDEFVMVKYVK
jgi:RimJ/RimL family protein N-acetyltransferase